MSETGSGPHPSRRASPTKETGSLFAGAPPRSSRRDTRIRRVAYRIAAPLLTGAARLLWSTLRAKSIEGEERALELVRTGQPVVPCMWHRQLVVGVWVMLRLQRAGMRMGSLISPSLDGEVPALIAKRFGVHVVRGSATRTGVKAMRDLHRAVKREGVSPVMLADGPTGPPSVLKGGTVMLSQLAGAPILPIACAVSPALPLPTWDRMLLPMPFARVAIVFGEPIVVERELPPDGLEAERVRVERLLREVDERAQGLL
ncbi:MAG: lysophospholipid acyltransferase family protein [Planctomycetota bacterium]|nr:lysophospholipid acyltransferase family protein [Planctomycetota bacterium]